MKIMNAKEKKRIKSDSMKLYIDNEKMAIRLISRKKVITKIVETKCDGIFNFKIVFNGKRLFVVFQILLALSMLFLIHAVVDSSKD